ncbi:hypothetical protein PRIPAC_98019 [Pristionchus pacificus]|uniref:Uncharacterized protein n=1 Tax=Pristionchus pacificus TaxID=54126 RepID=A0A2A6BDM7_PRIPA|nr:hypothetical protein PRIPAC_98019 [Pristionchus pacificus]|eukprot:PDM63979.1 hypothetical protein PRIPAC_49480 [Pristionchus pacificus]
MSGGVYQARQVIQIEEREDGRYVHALWARDPNRKGCSKVTRTVEKEDSFGAPALVKAFEERKATGRFILHDEEYVPEPEDPVELEKKRVEKERRLAKEEAKRHEKNVIVINHALVLASMYRHKLEEIVAAKCEYRNWLRAGKPPISSEFMKKDIDMEKMKAKHNRLQKEYTPILLEFQEYKRFIYENINNGSEGSEIGGLVKKFMQCCDAVEKELESSNGLELEIYELVNKKKFHMSIEEYAKMPRCELFPN